MTIFEKWLEEWMVKGVEDYTVVLLTCIYWFIWKARCSMIFEEEENALSFLAKDIRFVHEYWSCMVKRQKQ